MSRAVAMAVLIGAWCGGVCPGSAAAAASAVDHAEWDRLVRRYVAPSGFVDYAGFARERASLDRYLTHLEMVPPEQPASHEERLAFWINAYNAAVVAAVLDHHPAASVKDVPGFFDRARRRIAGQDLTLDEIERAGHRLGDWRSHMAVVCASAGCPTLRGEAYVPERLDTQLAEQTRRYLADPQHGLRIEGSTLWLSHIFKWAARDITPTAPKGLFGPTLRVKDLLPVVGSYLPPDVAERLRRERLTIQFIPYEWSLNGHW